MRRLHLLSGREFHPLEAPGLSWRTVMQKQIRQQWTYNATLWCAFVTVKAIRSVAAEYTAEM